MSDPPSFRIDTADQETHYSNESYFASRRPLERRRSSMEPVEYECSRRESMRSHQSRQTMMEPLNAMTDPYGQDRNSPLGLELQVVPQQAPPPARQERPQRRRSSVEKMYNERQQRSNRSNRRASIASTRKQMASQDLSHGVLYWATKVDSLVQFLQSIVTFVLSIFISKKYDDSYTREPRQQQPHIRSDKWIDIEAAERAAERRMTKPSSQDIYPEEVSRERYRKRQEFEPTVTLMDLNCDRPKNRRPPLGRILLRDDDPACMPSDSDSVDQEDTISVLNVSGMPSAHIQYQSRPNSPRRDDYIRRGAASGFPRSRTNPTRFPNGKEFKQNPFVARHDSVLFLHQ